jgi:AraC-like DNA-binding protein
MKSVIYHSFEDTISHAYDRNSRASETHPFEVNCAGFITINPPFTASNPRGRADYYLMYINDGYLRVDLGAQSIRCTAGDAIIFPPKYKYSYAFMGSNTVSYYFVHFTGSHVRPLFETLGFSNPPTVFHAGNAKEALQGFSDMFEAYVRDDDLRDVSTAVALEQILISLARASRKKEAPAPLERSTAYIRSFYSEDINIPELAAMEGLSVSRYNSLFKETLGMSPIRYITDLRMKQACALLKATSLHIKEIGENVGYRDNHFFSKTFKAKIGLSPSEYRNS